MKKAELRKIMKRAWEIKKSNTANIFSLCLKMAWAEFKNPFQRKKGGRTMKVQNIKKGFYTDGERLFSKADGYRGAMVWMPSKEESTLFLASGNYGARFHEDIEVRPVKAGMLFHNGEIEVIDKNTILITKITPINPKYDAKGHCIAKDGYKTEDAVVRA